MQIIPADGPTSFNLALRYVDKKGNTAPVDGIPVWTPPDPSLATLVAAADGMSAVFTLADPINLGGGQININVDADLGEGIVPVITLWDFDVVAGQAVAGIVTATPVDDGTGGAP